MSYKNNKIFGLIPARGGSKGIPRKNLAKIAGMSLIALAAKASSQTKYLDHTIISTDDREMADEAERYGVDAPFLRPSELAADDSLAIAVWKHAWLLAEKQYGNIFEASVLIEPTSPMRASEDIDKVIELLFESGGDSAVTVSRTPAHFSPHKALFISEDDHLKTFHLEGEKYSIRQKIPAFYHRNGIAYAVKRKSIIEKSSIFGENCFALVIDRHVVNIDDVYDLEFARYLQEKQI